MKAAVQTDDRFNGDTFLDFLKTIHSRFPKCHLFMDKASPHYRSRKVKEIFGKQRYSNTSVSSNCVPQSL